MELLLLLKGNYTREMVPSYVSRLIPGERELLQRAMSSKDEHCLVLSEIYQSNSLRIHPNAWQQLQEASSLIMKAMERPPLRNDLAWLWPKGYRRNHAREVNIESEVARSIQKRTSPPWSRGRPRDIPMMLGVPEESREVAMREFMEESGLKSIPCPYTVSYESFDYSRKTSLSRIFATKCWVCILRDELPLPPVEGNEVEVRQRKWFSTEEVEQLLEGVELEAFQKGKELVACIRSAFIPLQ